jgi:AraC family transcriptional regulator of adaptative response / DNA-3-methyladenine glycosylase II
MPLCDIAFASGFRSVRRFNDAFRATYGRPPSSFRKTYQANELGRTRSLIETSTAVGWHKA